MSPTEATPVDPVAVDEDWGRVPGLRPPLATWAPLVWFVALALVLSFVIVALVRPPGPLDQPDPAYQRDGLLLDGTVVPAQVAGVDFEELRAGFEAGPYATAAPLAVETPFTLVLVGRLVRGRIDAVFTAPDGRAQVVDWKTGDARRADPLQLACYRLAWAELTGVPVESVDAVFYDLRAAEIVRPADLPDRAGLEALVTAVPGSVSLAP